MREERGARALIQGPRVKSMEVDDGKWGVGGITTEVRFLLLLTPIDICSSLNAMNKMTKSNYFTLKEDHDGSQ